MARHETEALWALAGRELETEARARVEAHVAECPDCTRRLVEAREARELLRTVAGQEPRVRWAEVDDRVLTLATRRLSQPERWDWWPWGVAMLWACAAAVLVVLTLLP
jgi:anti-sigma factor RsiW